MWEPWTARLAGLEWRVHELSQSGG
eukprot:SAG22_NODE_15501_length_347_cov_0.830645_1_plen_24_part_01